jgi:hypothetical protein
MLSLTRTRPSIRFPAEAKIGAKMATGAVGAMTEPDCASASRQDRQLTEANILNGTH